MKTVYNICYAAKNTILQKESITVGKENPLKVYYHCRNRILFMRRNMDFFHLLIFTLFFTLLSTPKSIFQYLIKGQYKQLTSFLKGIWWNLYSSTIEKNIKSKKKIKQEKKSKKNRKKKNNCCHHSQL
jgi:hypothetical protein